MPDDVCRCGHVAGAHRHYRRGRDCALCDCPRFRATQGGWRTWLSDRRRSPS